MALHHGSTTKYEANGREEGAGYRSPFERPETPPLWPGGRGQNARAAEMSHTVSISRRLFALTSEDDLNSPGRNLTQANSAKVSTPHQNGCLANEVCLFTRQNHGPVALKVYRQRASVHYAPQACF